MSSSIINQSPHSEEYFGDDRDFFWNKDFLSLISQRLRLQNILSVADIGCGVGHWSELIYPHVARGATFIGIDREPKHLTRYRLKLERLASSLDNIASCQADALHLPMTTGSVELATCQTLLLHLTEPDAALAEMVRMTRPGGLVLCAEPNNLVARLPFAGMSAADSPELLLRLTEFAWRHAIGRQKRGLGAEFIGEQLPGLFKQVGLANIQVWLSDKTVPFIPPYRTDGERAILEASDRWQSEGIGPFNHDEMRLNVLAGGGTEHFFSQAWADFIAREQEAVSARAEQRWHTAGGVLFYVVAGRKPG